VSKAKNNGYRKINSGGLMNCALHALDSTDLELPGRFLADAHVRASCGLCKAVCKAQLDHLPLAGCQIFDSAGDLMLSLPPRDRGVDRYHPGGGIVRQRSFRVLPEQIEHRAADPHPGVNADAPGLRSKRKAKNAAVNGQSG
jgi:hypothetical protein